MSETAPLVFVVDDEKIIANTLRTILEMNGFRAMAFVDPLEALHAAAINAPDLLIADVVMPGMMGTDLAIRIKEQHPGCKVLLFSGQARTMNLLEQTRAQGHNFTLLTKPVHPSDLLREINTSYQ